MATHLKVPSTVFSKTNAERFEERQNSTSCPNSSPVKTTWEYNIAMLLD